MANCTFGVSSFQMEMKEFYEWSKMAFVVETIEKRKRFDL